MIKVYYNEIDPHAAAWLRELIKAGEIADGEVDERSIEDVVPAELAGFNRCHFFAGIGVWEYALQQAGWPNDRRVWSGSCPCQPYSAAGKGGGFDDERHLWPAWFHLIEVCRPDTIFGEQVAAKSAMPWLDLVYSDLEGIGYTPGAIDFPAASVGAPHIRQRLYFVADTANQRTRRETATVTRGNGSHDRVFGPSGPNDCLASAKQFGRRGWDNGDPARDGGQIQIEGRGMSGPVDNPTDARRQTEGQHGSGLPLQPARSIESSGDGVVLDDTVEQGLQGHAGNERDGCEPGRVGEVEAGPVAAAGPSCGVGMADATDSGHGGERNYSTGRRESIGNGPTNGFWQSAEGVYCTDEKYRPAQPGIFPLVARSAESVVRGSDQGEEIDADNTAEARVMRLRGYGNAINAEQATAFISAYLELK